MIGDVGEIFDHQQGEIVPVFVILNMS